MPADPPDRPDRDAPTYRASVGDRSFDLTRTGDGLRLDGRAVDCSFERVGEGVYSLVVDGRSRSLVVEALGGKHYRITAAGRQVEVRLKDEKDLLLERFGLADVLAQGLREVRAPMPGLVVSVAVEVGQEVAEGDSLLVLEAMKMENELRAEASGVVKAVHVRAGEAVGKNALLVECE